MKDTVVGVTRALKGVPPSLGGLGRALQEMGLSRGLKGRASL